MKVVAVGCPEGRDATVWHTVVRRPRILNFLSGNPNYEAVECDVAPKEGRSGGGLYTTNGYVVGVCNFAEPQGNHGLYATPRSIYSILNRNQLASLYAPVRDESATLVADRRPAAPSRRNAPVSVARAQSPEPGEPEHSQVARDQGMLMVPAPSLMHITDPVTTRTERKPVAASGTTRRASWQATPDPSAKAKSKDRAEGSPSDRGELAAAERPEQTGEETPAREREFNEDEPPARSNSGTPPKTRWKAVKLTPRDQAQPRAQD